MFTLIKREVYDHLAYFVLVVVFSGIFIGVLISSAYEYDPRNPPVVSIGAGFVVATIAVLGFCLMGASQMYTDRTRKISAFLSTLPVSRSRILVARIITGILAIVVLVVPVAITAAFLQRVHSGAVLKYPGVVSDVSMVSFLAVFACYCMGLQSGWNSNKLAPALGGLLPTCVLITLMIIKGFGLYIMVMLVLFIAACLVRTWHKFMSTSL